MVYAYSALFLCMSTETITDMANVSMGNRHHAPHHSLKKLAYTQAPEERAPEPNNNEQWTQAPTELQVHALAQVDVYLDDFISTYQGGPTEQQQMLRHLFRSIDTVFRLNATTDGL